MAENTSQLSSQPYQKRKGFTRNSLAGTHHYNRSIGQTPQSRPCISSMGARPRFSKTPPLTIFGESQTSCTWSFWQHCIHARTQWEAKKLDPKSTKMILVGYSLEQKGNKCFNPTTLQSWISRDVLFYELASWYGPASVTPSVFETSRSDANSASEEEERLTVIMCFCKGHCKSFTYS